MGGVGSLRDLEQLLELGMAGAVVGKAIYEGKFTLKEALQALFGERGRSFVSLARRILPCLDVRDGRTVKGINFLDLVDAGDPVEQARAYAEQGADEIVFLDISATPEGRSTLVDRVRAVARSLDIPFSVGGGIRSLPEGGAVLEAGADKFAINSAAVADPGLIERCAQYFGSQCVVVSIDAKRVGDHWEVFVSGGSRPTGKNAITWAREVVERGAGEILLTSMDRDGTQVGYDLELLGEVTNLPVPVIASGGAGSIDHLAAGLEAGADAVLLASLLHFGTLKVGEIKKGARPTRFSYSYRGLDPRQGVIDETGKYPSGGSQVTDGGQSALR